MKTDSKQLEIFVAETGKPSQQSSPTIYGPVVYRASAGSGKTYILTLEYLKQALSEPGNSGKFKESLAVTFTNKATDEMKSRIVDALNNIAKDKDETLLRLLVEETGFEETVLRQNAQKVLTEILHDYSRFAVSTIDKFFQNILHSFVREAGLRPGFRPETDRTRLLEEAVDRMMIQLHEQPFLYDLMSDAIDERIESGSGWDIRTLLKSKGELIFGEQFRGAGQSFFDKIRDSDFMAKYSDDLRTIIETFDDKMQRTAETALKYVARNRFDASDFLYKGSGAVNYFFKLSKGEYAEPGRRLNDVLEGRSSWFSEAKRAERPEADQLAAVLTELAEAAVSNYRKNGKDYFTAKMLLKSVKLLTFLAEVENNVRAVSGEENLLPISETGHLIGKLIDESDAPFIYERTGARFSTFMIDEFQDTSDAQWRNFKPLITDGVSRGNFSMAVGDVKQSIYRWRSGDWRILSERLEKDFKNFGVRFKTLDTNYRSKPCVVRFNNLIFSEIPKYIESLHESESSAGILSKAYSESEQKVAGKSSESEGYVAVSEYVADKEKSARERISENLPKLVAAIQDRGYAPGDVGILVRKAADGEAVADCMMRYKQTSGDTTHRFDVVSHDALFINRSPSVRLIVALLRAMVDPDDEVNNAFINLKLRNVQGEKTLPGDFSAFFSEIDSLSLPEIFEQLIARFFSDRNIDDIAFIQELHDEILKFSHRNLSDIRTFLDFSEGRGRDVRLSSGDTSNAVNITTIHKSKGLEYPVVIIPFCDWEMKPRSGGTTEIWVEPNKPPFDALPRVPVYYGVEMRNSLFEDDYKSETEQSLSDNVNLMYVAFTRARNELHIMLPLPESSGKNENVDKLRNSAAAMKNFIADKSDLFSESGFVEREVDGVKILEIGKTEPCDKQNEKSDDIPVTGYKTSKFEKKLRLKYESTNYFSEPETTLQMRNYGFLMHKAFASIKTFDDVPSALKKLVDEGYIEKNEMSEAENRIRKALANPDVKKWFDGSYGVLTEQFVLKPSKAGSKHKIERCPDRIMSSPTETLLVDCKFGSNEAQGHEYLLKNSVRLFEEMNFPDVKGFIWFVDDNVVKAV